MERPSIYTSELATKICELNASGESLRAIRRDEEMPSAASVFSWLVAPEEKAFLAGRTDCLRIRFVLCGGMSMM
jgi:hypothetical protein